MENREEKSLCESYRILARKYRPQNFSDLIGQEPVVRTLKNAFEVGRLAQAWIFTGVRGVGKTTIARILARALNYEDVTEKRPSANLVVPGKHCQAIMAGQHVDVVEMDAASHTGIDDIREIVEQIRYHPVSARYKVYIIDEVHMLSVQAFNGLLKTLEEPPCHVKFIFATTEVRKVPVTVLSRCQRFDLRRVSCTTLMDHLKKISDAEGIKIEKAALAAIARAGDGSVRDALSILDQAIAHSWGDVQIETVYNMLGLADSARVIDLFENVMNGNITAALREFRELYNAGADPAALVVGLADFNHFITRLRFTPEIFEDISLPEEYRVRGKEFARKLSLRFLARSWQMLLKGITEIENSVCPLIAAEMLLIRLTHASELPTLDVVLESIEDKEDVVISAENSLSTSTILQSEASASSDSDSLLISEENSVNILKEKTVNKNALQSAPKPKIKREGPIFRNLEDIALFAEKENEMILAFMVRECIRLVSFKQGHIEFVPTEKASYDLAERISQMLKTWTNNSWTVQTLNEGGEKTLAEKKEEKYRELLSNAENDPEVSVVLEVFPGAKIIDVRIDEEKDEMKGKKEIFS